MRNTSLSWLLFRGQVRRVDRRYLTSGLTGRCLACSRFLVQPLYDIEGYEGKSKYDGKKKD